MRRFIRILAKMFVSAKYYVNHCDDDRISKAIKNGYFSTPKKLSLLVSLWEEKKGDIRLNPTLKDALWQFLKSNPEAIPDHPHVLEIVGQFLQAAEQYLVQNQLSDAARCFELAGHYEPAEKLYFELGRNEDISRCAEARGDLEKALQYVEDLERKLGLLRTLKRYREAWDLAENNDELHLYKTHIQAEAAKHLKLLLRQQDYRTAIELSDVARQSATEREEIIKQARKHYLKLIADSHDFEEIKRIHKTRIELEEAVGNYAEAGRIAEEDLVDLALATLLYEKANLFDRAIEVALDQSHSSPDSYETRLRLAGLQERGGNLIKAAKLYESIGKNEKASEIYRDLGQAVKALECYLKSAEQDIEILSQLYIEAGDLRKAINLYLDTGEMKYYEKALEIARKHQQADLESFIQTKITEFMQEKTEFLELEVKKALEEISRTYSPIIGIDFGTTNSAAAVYNKFNRQVEIITDPSGEEYEPSFYGLDDHNHPIFGKKAKSKFQLSPANIVARVKRIVGEKRVVSIAGKNYRTEEVVGNILYQIKTKANNYLISKAEKLFTNNVAASFSQVQKAIVKNYWDQYEIPSFVKDVVLSVPAYFNNSQKRAIRDAAEIAGLYVRRLLHEPTAAALAYGHQKKFEGMAAIIDLGGGTLDVSILDISQGIYEVKTIFGDTKLGGSDIDAILVEEMVKDMHNKTGIIMSKETHPIAMARAEEACEQLKIALSEVSSYSITLPNFMNQQEYTFTLSREKLERLAEPFMKRLEDKLKRVLDMKGVNHYILVGNATKMPAVRELASRLFRFQHLTGIEPGTVVVCGDALEAAVLSGSLHETLLLDVVPYSLGISVLMKDSKDMEEFSKIIAKDCTIPTKNTENYTTTVDNQSEVNIKIYQGESMLPSYNHFLGNFILTGIAPAPAGIPKIEVTFDINADCILHVTAKDLGTGNIQKIKIEDTVSLSPNEMQQLKASFTEKELQQSLEVDISIIQKEIEEMAGNFDNFYVGAENKVVEFRELFADRVERIPPLYTASEAQSRIIQTIFIQKEQLFSSMPSYKERFASLIQDYRDFNQTGVNYGDTNICAKLRERKESYIGIRRILSDSIISFERDINRVIDVWIDSLKSMTPDIGRMNTMDAAKHYISLGQYDKAMELLEKPTAYVGQMGEDVFQLLEKCYVKSKLSDKYKELHRQHGGAINYHYPDMNKLNAYLKIIDESIVMIRVKSQQGMCSGSGFCFSPYYIATNKHVVQGVDAADITVIGKHHTYSVERVAVDPVNDIAVLSVKHRLPSLRMGEFDFVEPGEQVFAIGFPHPSSDNFQENIFISKGIVNAIKKSSLLPDRVLYIDSKVGSGMSGGPLINDLGEVVGVITLIEFLPEGDDNKFFQAQPIAQPIHLVKRLAL